LAERDVGLLMCDGDMYSSTKDCMKAGGPRVVPGGTIYNDDYFAFKECNKAVEEWLEEDQRPRSDVFIVSNKDPCSLNMAKDCVAPSGEGAHQKAGVCKVGDETLPFEASVFRIDAVEQGADALPPPPPTEDVKPPPPPAAKPNKPASAAKPKDSKPEKAKSPAKSPAKPEDKAKSASKSSASKSAAKPTPASASASAAYSSAAASPDAAPAPEAAVAAAPSAPAEERQAAMPAQRKDKQPSHKKVKYCPSQECAGEE